MYIYIYILQEIIQKRTNFACNPSMPKTIHKIASFCVVSRFETLKLNYLSFSRLSDYEQLKLFGWWMKELTWLTN